MPGVANQSFASWGGQAVFEDGMYHLIFADFMSCGLGCWGGASQLARAVSQHPLGPYKKAEVIAPPFRKRRSSLCVFFTRALKEAAADHNPTVNKVPGGPYVITAIGCAPIGGAPTNNCSALLPPPPPHATNHRQLRARSGAAVGDPAAAGAITMLYSDKITGPWKRRPGVILEPAPADRWDSFVTNPSLFFFPNGSALLAYRGGTRNPPRSSLSWPHPSSSSSSC